MTTTKIVAEIGVNHQGSVEIAKQLIQMAKEAGADAVKFQKRTPELNVPEEDWDKLRCTPFGIMSNLAYRTAVEFGLPEYQGINEFAHKLNMPWFVSAWDIASFAFIHTYFEHQAWPYFKIPSAHMENRKLQQQILKEDYKLIVSTGMHTEDEIEDHLLWLVNEFPDRFDDITIMLCNSAYPSADNEVNLSALNALKQWPFHIGFSSHSISPFVPIHAISYFRPSMIEVHITLDRTMKGSDHAASLERKGLELLVREKDRFYTLLGDGKLKLYDSELPAREKLKIMVDD